ncbi:hypothetical protein LEP1GSC193_2004 [Leptospira alstonii serovar Pingchang str. 80-412]|uniref:Uncharacterized protein n=1 Tax=Leptospira alstonii serovar Pingchang str. 80-412 TaxID=1218564 RepID=T0HCA6_9LEPT|nr:hypothetical protein LEP1GSC193_2004 [Leptospira alstonii serovar Pingchang str. 80-412]
MIAREKSKSNPADELKNQSERDEYDLKKISKHEVSLKTGFFLKKKNFI